MRLHQGVERAHRGDERECCIRRSLHRAVQASDIVVQIREGRRCLGDEIRGPERIQPGTDSVAEVLQQRGECVLHPLLRVEVKADGELNLCLQPSHLSHRTHDWTAGGRRALNRRCA
jgi:hypothetical protein